MRSLVYILAIWVSVASAGERPYSPYAERAFPENLYWGDLHVHTRLSGDAYSMGVRLPPETAYRFARGETVISTSGQAARLSRPLDFMLISDHAEFLGVFAMLDAKDPLTLQSRIGKRWQSMRDAGNTNNIVAEVFQAMLSEIDLKSDREVTKAVWHRVTANADRFNQPGKFTAFIGFEWTSTPDGNNLHRNVIFRDGAALANRITPLSSLETRDPRDLWSFLSAYEERTGGAVMAIPHNGNASNGLMFSDKNYVGDPLEQTEALTRRRWEPLYETTQIKGDAETHPLLSPDDRFADYESWDKSNFSPAIPPKQPWMLKHEYARGALRLGLALESELGTNPFKFGLIGSTDSHTALATAEENNYFGKMSKDEPSAERSFFDYGLRRGSRYAASGCAAIWARENTRESLFAAMKRRETYATTGPRMTLRFFGGWNFDKQDHTRPDYVAIGYRKGVPMGGDLIAAANVSAPRFLIVASKDPDGANLERIQIVKGWLDSAGETHEKVWDVALSDSRQPKRNGKMLPPINSTVDIKTATYTNTVGAAQLGAVWEDPDFDAEQRAFYYVRVLEIPTPRWTTYDAVFFGTKLPEDVPAVQQERAYSSPIWYTP